MDKEWAQIPVGLLMMGLTGIAVIGTIGLPIIGIMAVSSSYCQNRESLKRDNPLSIELRPYDLNNDRHLDVSELEKFQRDYELKKK